jgi:hypothetical protein
LRINNSTALAAETILGRLLALLAHGQISSGRMNPRRSPMKPSPAPPGFADRNSRRFGEHL